ncbi:hypothetical protein [uncultured Muribaculum sp.]|uniref:hypothetical protein n=1 Tax=uncultured Muribaculum sp. TaxID=1918613 RepID=UPI0025B5FF72|nr:hypothetical protein [uncultured Muribaculum sp.]
MRIGLIDVDGHNFPNFALMRLSAWLKVHGDKVEWADAMFGGGYDRVYKSKIFTFSPDDNTPWNCEVICGGTGYDVKSRLPQEIEQSTLMDYSIYPRYDFSIQFLSRGCIRHCPFCLVHDKEGDIHAVEPVQLNPNGKHIEVLDNNFFANPEWKYAVDYLLKAKQKVNLHGVDVRIMDEEQAYWLNRLPLFKSIHIAWDLPQIDLTDKLREVIRYIKPWKLMCYILVGFNSTMEQDMYRIERCRELGIKPYVMPYRDFENKTRPSQYAKDLAQYVNKPMIFKSCKFKEFSPRKGFVCSEYKKINK